MNDEEFTQSIRKFLRHFGVTAQQEMERAVRRAVEDGTLRGRETIPVRATFVVEGLVHDFHVEGELKLE